MKAWLPIEAALFLLALALAPYSAPLWAVLLPGADRVVWTQQGWFVLLGDHLLLALGAAAIAAVLGLAAGVLATRPAGRAIRPVLDAVFTLAQAIPPIAVIALSLPLLGFGIAPTLLALVLYAALPVMRAAVAGLEAVPSAVLEAGRGAGMGAARALWAIELPLAMPVIWSGLRVAVVLSIATAAVGAIAGTPCLGTPIIVGLANGNMAFVLQGAVFTAWLALLVDRGLGALGGLLSGGGSAPA